MAQLERGSGLFRIIRYYRLQNVGIYLPVDTSRRATFSTAEQKSRWSVLTLRIMVMR